MSNADLLKVAEGSNMTEHQSRDSSCKPVSRYSFHRGNLLFFGAGVVLGAGAIAVYILIGAEAQCKEPGVDPKSRNQTRQTRSSNKAPRIELPLPTKDSDFRPKKVVKAFEPITRFPVKPVGQMFHALNPSELVLGVTIGKESRAYPINMLTGPSREILNDTLGGRSIAATW